MLELNRIIALKKDGSLIMFDDRAEFEKCNFKDYRRIWADGRAIITSLYHAEEEADELRTELASPIPPNVKTLGILGGIL